METPSTTKATTSLFDLTNVSPLNITRASWLLEPASRGGGKMNTNGQSLDSVFQLVVSPTASVYAPKPSMKMAAVVSAVDAGVVVDRVAVVKAAASAANVRVVVPVIVPEQRDDGDDDDGAGDDAVEESSDILFEARLRAAMEAEANGVDLSAMFGAKRGVANSPVGSKTAFSTTTAVVEGEEEAEDVVIGVDMEPEVCASPPSPPLPVETTTETTTADVEPESDAFERMLAKALDDACGASTSMTNEMVNTSVKVEDAVAIKPFEAAMPKREFKPKFDARSPEKYETVPKPEHSTSGLDFEAKLEAAMRAAELGGDLTAILSGPSSKVMNSPAGADAQSRVNFRELGMSKTELKHHELHVADSDVVVK